MRFATIIPPGSTAVPGSLPVRELDGDPDDVGYGLVVEAVGATPSITFKWQGSFDGVNWFDLLYITDSSDVATQAARTVTAVGYYVQWRSNILRRYRFIRCVPSAITNVTYHAEIIEFD